MLNVKIEYSIFVFKIHIPKFNLIQKRESAFRLVLTWSLLRWCRTTSLPQRLGATMVQLKNCSFNNQIYHSNSVFKCDFQSPTNSSWIWIGGVNSIFKLILFNIQYAKWNNSKNSRQGAHFSKVFNSQSLYSIGNLKK
jgi:hypothetical protein